MRCPVNHINELCISFMNDTLKDLFERCTDGIESPTVCSIMDTLRRQGLRNIDKYENIALLQKLEPIIRNAWANIKSSLVREKLVKDNDTEVVCARARITGIKDILNREVERERDYRETEKHRNRERIVSSRQASTNSDLACTHVTHTTQKFCVVLSHSPIDIHESFTLASRVGEHTRCLLEIHFSCRSMDLRSALLYRTFTLQPFSINKAATNSGYAYILDNVTLYWMTLVPNPLIPLISRTVTSPHDMCFQLSIDKP
jgi:hypothetical protein